MEPISGFDFHLINKYAKGKERMFRHRVAFIINSPKLERPVTFRTDVFLSTQDTEISRGVARAWVLAQQLPEVEFLDQGHVEVQQF